MIEINDEYVKRYLDDDTYEIVKWEKLKEVFIITTENGPQDDDLIWILVDDDGGCAVPSGAPEAKLLLERLQRLPMFNNENVIQAMSCINNGKFECWKRV